MNLFTNALLAAALFSGMVAFLEIGYRLGRRSKSPEESRAGLGLVGAAVFGLLGLLLAFEFSRAASRLDHRRELIVQEANAIGTAYLRLDLLAAERQPALRDLFRQYADSRLRVGKALPDPKSALAEKETGLRLQTQIWTGVVAAVRQEPSTAPAILLLGAVNEMIDLSASRHIAAGTHIAPLIVLLLFSVALMSAVLAGYSMSSENRRNWLHVLVFAAVIAVSVFVVLDLEYPRRGFIRIGAADQALVEVRKSMD